VSATPADARVGAARRHFLRTDDGGRKIRIGKDAPLRRDRGDDLPSIARRSSAPAPVSPFDGVRSVALVNLTGPASRKRYS
jgi:hypothetical protein